MEPNDEFASKMMPEINTTNPYESPETASQRVKSTNTPRAKYRWILIGCLIFAALPVAVGAYGIYRETTYHASLPRGTAACGMGTLASIIIATIGAPIFGLIGGLVGWVASSFKL